MTHWSFDLLVNTGVLQQVSPSLDSPEPWVKSSWYCLFGKDSGKILDIRGLRDRNKQSKHHQQRQWTCYITQHIHRCAALPHSVRQSQHAQAEEVDRQQQVDVLLRKYLRQNTLKSDCWKLSSQCHPFFYTRPLEDGWGDPELPWRRGRAQTECSWRWWGTWPRLDRWSSPACLMNSGRRHKEKQSQRDVVASLSTNSSSTKNNTSFNSATKNQKLVKLKNMTPQNSHQQLQAAMNWFHYDWNIGYSYKIYRVGVNDVGIGLNENTNQPPGTSGATSAVQPPLSLTAKYKDFSECWVGASLVTDTEVTADWISRVQIQSKVTIRWVLHCHSVHLHSDLNCCSYQRPETEWLQQVYRRVPEREARESPPSIFSSIYSPERENGTGEERGGEGQRRQGQKMEEEKRRGSLFLH